MKKMFETIKLQLTIQLSHYTQNYSEKNRNLNKYCIENYFSSLNNNCECDSSALRNTSQCLSHIPKIPNACECIYYLDLIL